ncbi:MAG: septum formation family protein [Acidimicrobiia bacterium]
MSARTAALVALLLAVAGACDDGERNEGGQVSAAGNLSVYDLKAGDCFNRNGKVATPEGEDSPVEFVESVPCDESHESEVFGVFEHPLDPGFQFPGGRDVTKVAQDGCVDRFEDYIGTPFGDSDLLVAVIAPGEVSWVQENDRTIVCLVNNGDKALEKSVKNSGD